MTTTVNGTDTTGAGNGGQHWPGGGPAATPPWHPAWQVFLDGYAAGMSAGIGLGRAQVDWEWATGTTPTYDTALWSAEGLSRHEFVARQRAERQAARREFDAARPPLTAEQITDRAHRSWGLPAPARRPNAA